MKSVRGWVGILALGLGLGVWSACGGEEDDPLVGDESRCGSSEYLAFDALNHEPQDKRLAAFDEMLVHMQTAADDPEQAEQAADAILALYQDASLKISQKTAERIDVDFSDAPLGAELDLAFRDAIESLRASTTSHEVKLSKQWLEKAGMYRFLYHSVMYELHQGTKKNYDEAFGYLGTGQRNLQAERRGLARLAGKRDLENETNLSEELFALIVDGGCALEKAGETPLESQAYLDVSSRLDKRMQTVLATSIGHELKAFETLAGKVEDAEIKLWETEGFFLSVERRLLAGTPTERSFAEDLRAAIKEAREAEDEGWIDAFPAADLLSRLEAIYGIKVKK